MASKPNLADGIAMMKPDDDFQVLLLMMDRKRLEQIILAVLNEQYLGDDNTAVPAMIVDAILADVPPVASSDPGANHKGCWG